MPLKPDSTYLALFSIILGVFTLAPALFSLVAPVPAARVYRAFPRSVWPGRILAVICVVCSAIWSISMPFPFLPPLRPWLWIIVPLVVAAFWIYIPDLLSCRAFGGLLALVPSPLLHAAQWHPSAWRYVIIVYAYALAVLGMFYIALPYLMRDHITWAHGTPLRARVIAASFAALGALLIALSVLYR